VISGTRSYLFGCHSFWFHPILVILAWRKRFGRWPASWQIVCIFIHDIGVVGMDYLKAKDGHWVRGAELARKLFGDKGYLFCAGHTNSSGVKRSDLFWADKGSWLIAPMWWLWLNYWIDIRHGSDCSPRRWKLLMSQNIEKEDAEDAHQLYLRERRGENAQQSEAE